MIVSMYKMSAGKGYECLLRPRPATDQVKGTKPAETRVNQPGTSATIHQDRAAPPSSLRKRVEGGWSSTAMNENHCHRNGTVER